MKYCRRAKQTTNCPKKRNIMSTQTEQAAGKSILLTKQKVLSSSIFSVLVTGAILFAVYLKNGRMFTINDPIGILFFDNIRLPFALSRWCDILIGPICSLIFFPLHANRNPFVNPKAFFRWDRQNGVRGLYTMVFILFFIGYICGIVTGLFYGIVVGVAIMLITKED